MEDKLFSDMPSAPKAPKLPKHFPDLQGSLRGRTPEAGWYQNDFLPWIQNEEVKNVLGYGIGIVLAFCLGALMGSGNLSTNFTLCTFKKRNKSFII